MNPNLLDSAVVNLLQQNRKIEAIKQLREQESIGLKEAKEAVETYLANHPEMGSARRNNSSRSSNTLFFFIAIACVLYLGYSYFA